MMFHGRTALVTGGSRGIGATIAQTLGAAGASIIVADLTTADAVVDRITRAGGRAMYRTTDITDHSEVESLVSTVEADWGPIDILVNNAGIISRGTIFDITYEDWDRIIAVNLTGTFNCCKAVIPSMVRHRRGCIVNISSIAGKVGDITAAPAYGTSKGGVNALTKSLARQLADYGVRVNAVAPHAIETEMSGQWSEEKRRTIIESIPLHRLGTPQEVADAVVFLASDQAGFITGEILDVNGGYLMD